MRYGQVDLQRVSSATHCVAAAFALGVSVFR
jgi:hypothetical protein